MVNSNHLNCLEMILDEDKVFNRIVVEAKEIRTNWEQRGRWALQQESFAMLIKIMQCR
jgi:hypothetical protein